MLRVGLTGGIGAGKSTVARRLVELGATLVDADLIAREVVLPGSVGLARVVERFGDRVLDAEGQLDRPALAGIVFGDQDARLALNGILHPLIRARTAELISAAPADCVLVHDVPLLVEGRMSAAFPLVLVVDAPEDERVRRLVGDRGMTEQDARARIAAQADHAARRAAADVWLDNSGQPDEVRAELDRLWRERLVPFERALRAGTGQPDPVTRVHPDPSWPEQFARLAARVEQAAGGAAVRLDHVGATAVAGLACPDVIDIQVAVRTTDEADAMAPALREVGFLPAASDDPARGPAGCLLRSADPGRAARVFIRELGSPGYRQALLVRDWLRSDAAARADYEATATGPGQNHATRGTQVGYSQGQPPWSDRAAEAADRWATSTGWRTPEQPADGAAP